MAIYRSRFAPTPSGPLHFGSLFAAVVSYLDAKANGGQWLLRIEDIDPPREQPGASAAILRALEAHGLLWDETETYQSDNSERYRHNLELLRQQHRLFWCDCSRKQLSGHAIYPGHCRSKTTPQPDHAVRLRVTCEHDSFYDLFQGQQQCAPVNDWGDVILQRRDKLWAYQLAVVSDDIAQNISHVIRGIDLMHSVFWQRELYRALSAKIPVYGHFPVVHAQGSDQKLSKQNLAPAIDDQRAVDALLQVFRLLNLNIDKDSPRAMLNQAQSLWQRTPLIGKQFLHTAEIQLD